MTGLLESAAGKLSFVWTHDRSVRSFNRSRRSPARLAIQRHRKVRSCCQGTLEYALLLVRFGLWRGTLEIGGGLVVVSRVEGRQPGFVGVGGLRAPGFDGFIQLIGAETELFGYRVEGRSGERRVG